MARAAPVAVLVACVLVMSAIGSAAVPRSSPPAQLDDGRTADVGVLGLDSPTRSDVAIQGVDVSSAVAIQRQQVDAAVERRALEIAFERTEDEQERRAFLFEAATDVEIATSSLRSEQRDVREGYVNGAITPGTYMRSRALANARAEEWRADLELIQRLADRVPQLSMRSRLEALDVALTGVGGPVTEQLEATLVGEQAPVETYVEVSPNGRVLAMITDGGYVREAHRADAWTPDTTSGIRFDEAEERMGELYPVAFHPNTSRRVARSMSENGAGTYRVSMELREGTITTYLDGDTQNIFFEVQDFHLVQVVPGPSISASGNGTRLVVNRSIDGGPLRVATYDNTTGAPVDVTVLVDDNTYRTGSDGTIWTLDPAGTTEVVAVGEAGNVSVTVPPLSPSLVNVQPVDS